MLHLVATREVLGGDRAVHVFFEQVVNAGWEIAVVLFYLPEAENVEFLRRLALLRMKLVTMI